MDDSADRPAMAPAMALAIDANFGSYERWRDDFAARAEALAAGGSVLLAFDPQRGTLHNRSQPGPVAADRLTIISFAAPARVPAGAIGATSPEVQRAIAGLDWGQAYQRYQEAVHLASESLAAAPDELDQALLLDVRRAGAFEQAETMLPGACWRDPASVGDWAGALPADRRLVVYCVYGHEVGRATALRLRAAGRDARFLEGGIDGWQRAGRPLTTKGDKP